MNIPNMLTLSRLVLAFVILALLSLSFPYAKTLALIVFAVAGFTDFLDGYLARKVYGVSSFGKLMDPLADKIMVSAVLISFVGIQLPAHPQGPPFASLVPAFLVVIIIAREFMVTGLRLLAAGEGKIISAGKWGKHKTIWQIIGIVIILLGLALREDFLPGKALTEFDLYFAWTALGLTLAVSLITVISGLKYFSEHNDLYTQNM